jgi:hypothetical protein
MNRSRSTKARPRRKGRRVTFETVCELGLALPGVLEGTSYGTPALKVGGKLIARLREDGDTLAIRIDFHERERLIEADPQTFYITDHYLTYPFVLVRLPIIRTQRLRELLEGAWRRVAPKRLVAAFDVET